MNSEYIFCETILLYLNLHRFFYLSRTAENVCRWSLARFMSQITRRLFREMARCRLVSNQSIKMVISNWIWLFGKRAQEVRGAHVGNTRERAGGEEREDDLQHLYFIGIWGIRRTTEFLFIILHWLITKCAIKDFYIKLFSFRFFFFF